MIKLPANPRDRGGCANSNLKAHFRVLLQILDIPYVYSVDRLAADGDLLACPFADHS
jgi:hypothetical protein